MNKRIKAKWIKALRSGDYRQTDTALRKGGAFCCLGVLCNIHAQEHPKIAARQRSAIRYMGKYDFPPQTVLAWAGLETDNGTYKEPRSGRTTSLAAKNDEGKSFAQIANIIEKHF